MKQKQNSTKKEKAMVEIEGELYFTSDSNLEFDEELEEYKIKKYEN